MRDYLNTNDSPNSYCGIIQEIHKSLSEIKPTTEEGANFVNYIYSEFQKNIDNNWMPLLFIGGIENKEKYLTFQELEPTIFNFGVYISELIKTGDYNLLVNLCAEEHYKNSGTYPEWLESELKSPSAKCKNYILTDAFDTLTSELYTNIKSDLVQTGELSIDETKEMYDTVISNIKNYMMANSVLDTPEGQKVFDAHIGKIYESNTPVMDLKEFKTNAEQAAPHDAKLIDILKFVNKNIKNSPSLNVLLNIAKEEHLQNVGRADQPESDETYQKLKEYWSAGDSEIELAIKNGTFDKLKSNLLMNLKSDIIPDSNSTKILNVPEEAPMDRLLESLTDVKIFSPIGVTWDDIEDNQKYAFIEDEILQLQEVEGNIQYQAVSPEQRRILSSKVPDNLKRFTESFKELAYDPIKLEFRPAMSNWDFDIKIGENGVVTLCQEDAIARTASCTEVDKHDLRLLFTETLDLIKSSGISETEIKHLERDADNFIIVAMNYSKLLLFDDLLQIQSLFENQYAIVPDNVLSLSSDEPQAQKTVDIITGSVDKTTKQFKSYQELVNAINKNVGLKTENSVNKIFEHCTAREFNRNFDRQTKIGALKEQQQQINNEIQSKNNLLKIAEPESPAHQKLQKELDKLNSDLDTNIQDLNYYVNDFDVLNDIK